jgi:hypothetical protein
MTFKARSITVVSLLLAIVALFYASCKKSETSGIDNGINKKEISIQLAKNLYASFTGSTDASRKMAASVSRSGLKVNTTQCGTSVDSVVNSTIIISGTSTQISTGHINTKYICDNNGWTIGYTLTDSLRTIRSLPTYDYEATVKQKYDAIAKNYNYGVVTVNGTQQSHIIQTNKFPTPKTTDQFNNFTLKEMVVDALAAKGADIISGTALFDVHGTMAGTAFSFPGEIAFIGDYKVVVSFSGEAYTVNMLTDEVTPAK